MEMLGEEDQDTQGSHQESGWKESAVVDAGNITMCWQ